MTTDIALRTDTELSPWAAFAAEGEAQAIAGDLLSFSKGAWYSGQDKTPVKEGKSFVANLLEFYVGWIKWRDQKPVDMRLERVADRKGPMYREDLGDDDPTQWEKDRDGKPSDPWQQTMRLVMRAYKAEGIELYTFTTSSAGGRKALNKLCRDYEQIRRKHPDLLPVVKIGQSSWRHKDWGMISSPAFEVIGATTWEPGGKTIKLDFGATPIADAKAAAKQVKDELDDEIPF